MRKLIQGLVVLGLAAPTLALAQDPDKKVAGGGELPAGWEMRVDPKDANKPALPKLATMGPGLHVTSGSAAIYWASKDNAKGDYTIEATFTQMKAGQHAEAYGLFIGGQALKSPNQQYAYFLVRQDGKFMIKHRASDADVHTLMPWTENAAIKKTEGEGKGTNTLAVTVAGDKVHFLVNGTEVAALEKAKVGQTDGFAGLRVNHNLDVHVDKYAVKSAK